MIQIGKEIRVELTEFKGKKYIGIRKWYEKDGKTLPGKGISMNTEDWNDFVSKWEEIKKDIEGGL